MKGKGEQKIPLRRQEVEDASLFFERLYGPPLLQRPRKPKVKSSFGPKPK